MHHISSRRIPEIAAQLPPFPPVVSRLLDTLNGELVSIDELVRIARTDTVVSAAVLAAANGMRRLRAQSEISDLFAAASLIGVVKLKRIIMAMGHKRFLSQGGSLTAFHGYSVAVAIVAQELAQLCGLPTGEAYVAGLLHDVGQLVYHVLDADGYDELRQQALEQGDLLVLERERYGLDHAQIGLLLATHWQLPVVIRQAIAGHHERGWHWQGKLQAVMILAETLARALDLPPSPENRVLRVNSAALDYLGLSWDRPEMQDLFERSRARFATAQH